MNKQEKTYLVIGTRNFLYRLGVKTILSVIGMEVELIEASDMASFQSYLTDDDIKYYVLTEDLLDVPSANVLSSILLPYSEKSVFFVADKISNVPEGVDLIHSSTDQNEVLKAFQTFFFEEKVHDKEEKSVLTEREVDVLRHVALGLSNKEMADKLFISSNTVITHRKNITEKLGIKTIPGLTVYAIMHHIINPEEVKY